MSSRAFGAVRGYCGENSETQSLQTSNVNYLASIDLIKMKKLPLVSLSHTALFFGSNGCFGAPRTLFSVRQFLRYAPSQKKTKDKQNHTSCVLLQHALPRISMTVPKTTSYLFTLQEVLKQPTFTRAGLHTQIQITKKNSPRTTLLAKLSSKQVLLLLVPNQMNSVLQKFPRVFKVLRATCGSLPRLRAGGFLQDG